MVAAPMVAGSKAWSLVRPLIAVAQRHGLNPGSLERCLGNEAAPGQRRAVPIQRVFDLWAHVAAATQDVALPLRGAELLRIEDLELMGFSALTAPSGYAAFARAVRYSRLIASSGQWCTATSGDTVSVWWLRGGERWLGHRLATESGLSQFVSCLRQVYGPEFAPSRVTFRHRAPASLAAHRAFFRAPLEFGAARDGFSFPNRLLERAPRESNAALAAYLDAQAEAQLAALEPASLTGTLRQHFENELQRELPELSARRQARACGVSERTLRRRLSLEGTSFRTLLTEVQRDASRLLLQHSSLPITEVALRVGFSDAAAFGHAVRRWFGQAPRELRRESPLHVERLGLVGAVHDEMKAG